MICCIPHQFAKPAAKQNWKEVDLVLASDGDPLHSKWAQHCLPTTAIFGATLHSQLHFNATLSDDCHKESFPSCWHLSVMEQHHSQEWQPKVNLVHCSPCTMRCEDSCIKWGTL